VLRYAVTLLVCTHPYRSCVGCVAKVSHALHFFLRMTWWFWTFPGAHVRVTFEFFIPLLDFLSHRRVFFTDLVLTSLHRHSRLCSCVLKHAESLLCTLRRHFTQLAPLVAIEETKRPLHVKYPWRVYLSMCGSQVEVLCVIQVCTDFVTCVRKLGITLQFSLRLINPLNPELNPICYFWHY